MRVRTSEFSGSTHRRAYAGPVELRLRRQLGADVHELAPALTLVVMGGAYMTPMTIDNKVVQACDRGWQEFYAARLHQLADEMGTYAGRLLITSTAPPGPRWRERNTLPWVHCLNDTSRSVATERLAPKKTCRSCENCHLRADAQPSVLVSLFVYAWLWWLS